MISRYTMAPGIYCLLTICGLCLLYGQTYATLLKSDFTDTLRSTSVERSAAVRSDLHEIGANGDLKKHVPCYMEYCYCYEHTADCSDNGKLLRAIPKVHWERAIQKYYFRNNYLPNITKNTFEHIKNFSIIYLNLEGNQIYSIARKAFIKLPLLQTLHLSNNVINPKSLETAFINFPIKLNYLYLNNMSLTILSPGFFEGLRKTHIAGVHMTHNNLTEFNQTVIRGLKHLTTLNLKFNQISTLELELSRTLGSLWLNHNQLQSFPDMCPNGSALFPALWTLGLEFNSIASLSSSHFRCLTTLRNLFLSGNRISKISSYSFANLSNLQMLKLSQNMADGCLDFERNALNNTNLNYLNLSCSNVGYIPEGTFSECPSLRTLDLSNKTIHADVLSHALRNNHLDTLWCKNCGLGKIPRILKKMSYLRVLVLDGNSIDGLPNHVFDSNTALRRLSLRDNNITTLDGFAISYSLRYKLKYISLENNPFNCNCKLLWFKKWMCKDKSLFGDQYMNYKCASPKNYEGQMILDVGIVSDKVCLWEHSPFTKIICIAGTALIILVVCALLYKWRWKIRYCCMTRNQTRPAFTGETRPLLHNDAYVVYCEENYHPWIRTELMPNIEEHRALRLGIRQRDFDQTRHKVSNIVDSLRNCRKVVVVLSNSFFKDSESQDELSLVLKCLEGERGVLVVVLLEDVDERYRTNPLYRLLQKNDTIKWPTDSHNKDMFWTSLVSSLEDSNLHSFH